MRLSILFGSFMLLAYVRGGVVGERPVAAAQAVASANSVPVQPNTDSETCSSEELSDEFNPYNYGPNNPYQYYGYPPVNPRFYPQYPQYVKPQPASSVDSKITPVYRGVPQGYPPRLPPYYPQVRPYPQGYPQYPPPEYQYRPPYNQYYPGVNQPQPVNNQCQPGVNPTQANNNADARNGVEEPY